MHELAIAQSIIELADAEANRMGLAGLSAIGVRIGSLAGVNCEALRFGFTAIIAGTALEKTALEIEEIEARGQCLRCRNQQILSDIIQACPQCNGFAWEVIQGEELTLAYVAGDEKSETLNENTGVT